MHGSETEDRISECIRKRDLRAAKRLLLGEKRRHAQDPWVLTRLSFVYYCEEEYAKAVETSKLAYSIDPTDPVVIWDYARALLEAGHRQESIRLLMRVLRKSLRGFSAKGYSKGLAAEIKSDCRLLLSTGHLRENRLHLAAKYLREHISDERARGASASKTKEVEGLLRGIEMVREAIATKRVRLWISLLEVAPIAGNDKLRFEGAFTSGLTMSSSRRRALSTFAEALNRKGLVLVAYEDLEEFDRRCLKQEVPARLRMLAAKTKKTGVPHFDSFHTWKAAKS